MRKAIILLINTAGPQNFLGCFEVIIIDNCKAYYAEIIKKLPKFNSLIN